MRKGEKVVWAFKEGKHNVTGKFKSSNQETGNFKHAFEEIGHVQVPLHAAPARHGRRGEGRPLGRPRAPGLEPGQRREHQLADRLEVVAALLDDHRRQAERAELRARRRGSPSALTSSGLSGSPPAASTPSATTSARAPPSRAQAASSATASSHGPSPAPGASGGCDSRPRRRRRRARPAKPRKCGNQPAAGIDVDRAGEHRRVLVEDRLGAVAVVGVDVDHRDRLAEPLAQPGGGDGRVVEIAGAAEAAPRRVMARRPAERVGGRLAGERRASAAVSAASAAPRAASQVPGPIRVIVS